MLVELKNVRIAQFLSEETTAFSASVYIDGKRVASVENHGTGGNNMVHWADRDAERAFETYVATLPPEPPMPDYPEMGPLVIGEDYFFSLLLEKWMLDRDIAKWAKTNVVCKDPAAPKGDYVLFKLHPGADRQLAIRAIQGKEPNLEVLA
jgi:hypothetical protein